MTDLDTLAADINEALKTAGAPLMARAGERAINWFRAYAFGPGFYSIGKKEAQNVLRFYGLKHLAE